jgi:hypothetical protein
METFAWLPGAEHSHGFQKLKDIEGTSRSEIIKLFWMFAMRCMIRAWYARSSGSSGAWYSCSSSQYSRLGIVFSRVAFYGCHSLLLPDIKAMQSVIQSCDKSSLTFGNEMWENGEWSMTWQVKDGDPVHGKGYHASIAVREGAVWRKRLLVNNVTPSPAK